MGKANPWWGRMVRVFFQVPSWRVVPQQYRRIRAMWGNRVIAAFPVLVDGEPRIVVYLKAEA